MPDYGVYTGYIYASLGLSLLLLGGITIASLIGRATARRRLAALEAAEPRG